MKTSVWTKALRDCADPPRARHFLDLLAGAGAADFLTAATPETARILCALLSGSQALSAWLAANASHVALLTPDGLAHPRREQGLRREVDGWMDDLTRERDYAGVLARLREFKQRELLRIGARDLARLGGVRSITRELSDLADVCLSGVWEVCGRQLRERLGSPCHRDVDGRWHSTASCVFGMGKLGGQELNYSSDVDVIFVYAEEGRVFKEPPVARGSRRRVAEPPVGSPTNHQFFNRLAEMFIAEVGRLTAQRSLYRVDLRLRPEGDTGPLTRSLAGYENYYAQWGQTWERMMLIKARRVAGDEALAAEFIEMIQPFRFPRSVATDIRREVAAIKDRIENEVVKAGELDRNVKLGRGGIREIEFIAQTLQLLHAGRVPFLQLPQTLVALEKLAQYNFLARREALVLERAYVFLRDVEHRLQMENNLQTHTIPLDKAARERLARLMGFRALGGVEAALKRHTNAVRRVYHKFLQTGREAGEAAGSVQLSANEADWNAILARHGFKDAGRSVRLLHEFAYGPGYAHVSNRTVELALRLALKFLALCPGLGVGSPRGPSARILSDPDRVLTRLDSYITAYGARATLFETWNSNPALFELLLLLFDRSEFLAEAAVRTPDLVDELVSSDRLRRRKSTEEILEDLRHGRDDPDQKLWLRQYHRAELMRIGLRDILELAGLEQNLAELSSLADACLQYALEVAARRRKVKPSSLAIIGLGKLGGSDINYGSDLDLLFVTDARARELPRLQGMAVEILDLISTRTELGVTFATDVRLRPDGEKGLLVNTLGACESYYRQRARLWEIQALSRTRPVAGNAELGAKFQELAARLTDFTLDGVAADFALGATHGLAAYAPNWREQIREMRLRIERERTPPGKDALAIKTGAGGLMDTEFLAQMFCLAHGWREPNTLQALLRARDADALPRLDADRLIESYQQLRRVECVLRRWSFAGETTLPDDEAPFGRVAVRCGFAGPAAFRAALAQWRRSIREVFERTNALRTKDNDIEKL